MPWTQQHMAQAEHNQALLAHIEPSFRDWRVTVLFYVAVHLVEAFLDPKHSGDHGDRSRYLWAMRGRPTFDGVGVYGAYCELFNLSREARYDCICLSEDDEKDAESALQKIRGYTRWSKCGERIP